MRKFLLLMIALLTSVSGAWATDVAWTGATDGAAGANFYSIGITLPGTATADQVYTLSDAGFTLNLRGGDNVKALYMAICTNYGYAGTCSESEVIAVSNNCPTASTSGNFAYKFSNPVKLNANVTYYIQFFTSATPTDGQYTRGEQGVNVKVGSNGDYPSTVYYVSYSQNKTGTNWTPNFSATVSDGDNAWYNSPTGASSNASIYAIKLTTPSTNSHYALSAFNLHLTSGDVGAQKYMLISESDEYRAGASIPSYRVLGISKNNPDQRGDNVAATFLFDDVYLKGNRTYYLYFTSNNVPTSGSYTLVKERTKLFASTTNPSVYWGSAVNNYETQYRAVLNVLASAPAVTDSEGNELSEEKTYRIALPGRDGIVVMTQNGNYVNPQTWEPNTSQVWKVVKDGSAYKITAAVEGDSKYWAVDSYAEGNTKVSTNHTSAEATSWTISKVSTLNNTYNITSDNGSGTTYYFSNHGGGSNNMGFYNSNTGYDGGSLFLFTPVSENNYRCETLAGSVLQSGTGYVAAAADAAPVIASYTYSSVSEEMDGTIVFKYRMTTPPTIYTSPAPTENEGVLEFANSTIWYVIAQHNNYPKYWQLSGSNINGADNYNLTNNDYLWCFVGSEASGYQIYNRNGKAISFTTGGTANVSGITPSTFDIRLSNAAGSKFTLWLKDGVSGTRSYLNMNGKVQSWDDADAGSTFYQIEPVAIKIYNEAGVRDVVGGYSSADGAAMATAVETWNTDATESNFQALLDLYASTPLMQIEEDKYYKIVNVSSSGHLRTMSGKVSTSGKTGNDGIASQIWQFEETATDGQYNIRNVVSGQYVGNISTTENAAIPMSDDPVAITVSPYNSSATEKIFYSYTEAAEKKYMHESTGHDYGIIVWGPGATASHWTIQPADLSTLDMISPSQVSAGNDVYMSYANNTGSDKQMPADVTVYKVQTGGTKAEVTLTEVTTKVVPDGNGVILKAKKGITIPLLPTDATETLSGNMLEVGDGSATDGYLLAYKDAEDSEPKFYRMDQLVLANNKAYLPASYFSASVKELRLIFGDATAVNAVEAENPVVNGAIYNLAGQRMEKLQRGVNIVNGQKYIIK